MRFRLVYLLALFALTPACASGPAQEEPAGGVREINLTVGRDKKTGCTYIAEKGQPKERASTCNKLIVKGN